MGKWLYFGNGQSVLIYSQEEEYASVGHGIGQSQDSTSHNSITQVEDRHAKRGFSFKLRRREKKQPQKHTFNFQFKQQTVCCYCMYFYKCGFFSLTSVNRIGFFPSPLGKNSSLSNTPSGSSNLEDTFLVVN